MFGKLTLAALPLHQPLPLIASLLMIAGLASLGVLVVAKGWWRPLWHDWITSTDHKRIGVMYFALALVMLVRGLIDAIMMRSQLALAAGGAVGYLPPEHYNQIFSAHGTIMIFFVGMTFVVGLMNFVVPLQLGIRDVAFPVLNSVSLWLTAAGVLLMNVSLFLGEFARTGWLAYPPLSELAYSPGVGVDYYLWSLQISGVGTLLSGINLTTTILKMRAPGMGYSRMPVFCWTALASNLLIVAAFPILTATLGMLLLDRYVGFHFFTNDGGGNPMMYINLIWSWGHPEVYILILPAFGVFSEVIATFSSKPLFGYRSMVIATMGICVLSFMVWLHHFFTMGAGANVNAFFGIATMIIAVPTGVKIFNWLFTLYGGRIRFHVPVYWAIGFMVTFVIGGMTGVLMAIPPADFVLHNSLFLVAHFHNVIIGGLVFGAMAGYNYWFPKAFGFPLHEGLGKAVFWCWFVGFYLAFMPLYVLGLQGATRRMQHYQDVSWQPWMQVALGGALLITVGVVLTGVQLAVSIRGRNRRGRRVADPWNGRTLEWSTTSPPPPWNFARLPQVSGLDAYWTQKAGTAEEAQQPLEDIHIPRNSALGVQVAFGASVAGFALVWHIGWLAAVGLLIVLAALLRHAWDDDREERIPAGPPGADGRRAMSATFTNPASDPPEIPLSERGPAPVEVVVSFGFWLFLLSDIVMFAALFAAYAVLVGQVDGGPRGLELFDRRHVMIETGCLLASSFTCGLAMTSVERRSKTMAYLWIGATFLLGTCFVGLELSEFAELVGKGAGPSRSAFLSAFYALVGTHGLHVTAGLLWLIMMTAQIASLGFKPMVLRRMLCFSLFWHALDIVWIGVFTIVYLGAHQ